MLVEGELTVVLFQPINDVACAAEVGFVRFGAGDLINAASPRPAFD